VKTTVSRSWAGARSTGYGPTGLRVGVWLVALTAWVGIAAAPSLAAGAPSRLAGKVRAAQPDRIEVRAKGKTFVVHLAAKDALARAEAVTLAKLADGDPLVILGRRQEPIRDPNTQLTQPAQIVQIQTILVGAAAAVLLPKGQDPAPPSPKLSWLRGLAKRSVAGVSIKMGSDEINLQWGPSRKLLLLRAAKRSELRKGALVIVVGRLRREGRVRHLDEARVVIVDRRVPGGLLAPLVR